MSLKRSKPTVPAFLVQTKTTWGRNIDSNDAVVDDADAALARCMKAMSDQLLGSEGPSGFSMVVTVRRVDRG